MKISRLLEITIILLNRGSTTAKELAEHFEVSTRTIYRDIEALSEAGVPVYTNKGSGGGISLLEGFALNKMIISENEKESLLLALKTMEATKYPDIHSTLRKLGCLFKESQPKDWVEVDFSPWGSDPNRYHKFDDIKRAILERRVIGFDYINGWNQKSGRLVEPMKLIFKGTTWYLWGYCRTKEDFRTFKITRIKHQRVTDITFERRKLQQEKNGVDNAEAKVDVKFVNLKLKFWPEALFRLYDDYDDDYLIQNNDGTYEVNVCFPEDEWVYGYIMSFGCNVEVLEPEYIRKIISERMRKALDYYIK